MGDSSSPNEISLAFSNPFFPNGFLLLEVDKQMAAAVSSGQRLIIRGRESDSVILCTESSTFKAKDVEVSNSLLLISDNLSPDNDGQIHRANIVSITNHFCELNEMFPNQHFRLKELLTKNGEFDFGAEHPSADLISDKGIKFEQLLAEVQMSELQLGKELARFPLIDADGRLLLLSADCRKRFLDEVAEQCDKSLSMHFLTAESLRQFVPSAEVIGVDWFLRLFCTRNDDGLTYSIIEDNFVRERAEWLLGNNKDKQSWRLGEFEQSMAQLLPDGLHFRVQHHLHGIAFVSNSLVYGKTIKPLLPDQLPKELNERLAQLFKLKQSWKREELRPYVLDFCPNPAKMDELLMKHCKLVGGAGNPERSFIHRQL